MHSDDQPDSASPFEVLKAKCSREWPAITEARRLTSERLPELRLPESLNSDNTTAVVFGSLGRGELTPGSDADWSLLIDGPSDPEHVHLAQEIRKVMERLGLEEPGTTETFGTLANSHELIHHIGGVHDTNQNLTRRVLLLLESRALNNEIVHDRVIKGVLARYIDADASISWRERPNKIVPRFLLNDIVRFWRTMAVDYAAKRWEQANKKWALRNAKLRMSRKLLFVAGLLKCFSFELQPPEDRGAILSLDPEALSRKLVGFFRGQMHLTPVDTLAQALLGAESRGDLLHILDAYDRFLAMLSDEDARKRLERLRFDDAGHDSLFVEIRDLSHTFQEGLTDLFFDSDDKLRSLVIKYGVF